MAERRQARNTRTSKAKAPGNNQRTLFDLLQKPIPIELRKGGIADNNQVGEDIVGVGAADTISEIEDVIDCSGSITVDTSLNPSSQSQLTVESNQATTATAHKPVKKLFPIFANTLVKTNMTSCSDPSGSQEPNIYDLTGDDSTSDIIDLGSSPYPSHTTSSVSSPLISSLPPSGPGTASSSPTPHIPLLSLTSDDESPATSQRARAKKEPASIFVASDKRAVYKKPLVAVSDGKAPNAPFPDSHSQHVRGPQSPFSAPIPYSKRSPRIRENITVDGVSLIFISSLRCNDTDTWLDGHCSFRSSRLDSRPSTDQPLEPLTVCHARVHTSICRFLQTEPSQEPGSSLSHSQEMWTARWRPRCADEVLWNDSAASYLRDWLVTLGLRPVEKPPIDTLASSQASQGGKGRKKSKAKATESKDRGVKRPRVVRTVMKVRGRKKRRLDSDDELDFIAYSDESDGERPFAHEDKFIDDEDGTSDQFIPIPRIPSSPFKDPTISPSDNLNKESKPIYSSDFTTRLTNTIVLYGPSGSGKTAAIYACAEELGYKVFEVYPGIGRRNGANLENLVGDVGKNHLVKKSTASSTAAASTKTKSKLKDAFANLFTQSKKPTQVITVDSDGTEDRPIDIECTEHPIEESVPACVPISINHVDPTQGLNVVRQSLILLEEVDILFKEDTGFWSAVVELIKECKRPVVMTCNDIGLLPLADLPLQTILAFQPCPVPEAVSFLQSLCYAEGHQVSRERLGQVYQASRASCDAPLNAWTGLPVYDLRHAVNQLQVLCAEEECMPQEITTTSDRDIDWESSVMSLDEASANSMDIGTPKAWSSLCRRAELDSYMDCHLHRAQLDTPEALSLNTCEPSADDELGHSILFRPYHVSDTRDSLCYYHEDDMIVLEATRLARGTLEALDTVPINAAASGELFRSRVAYQTRMVDVLQNTVYPPAPLMPQAAVFLDYIPWVRYIEEVDDILERQAWDEIEKQVSGRLTRNSMKTRHGHVRTLDLSEEQRQILGRTKFTL